MARALRAIAQKVVENIEDPKKLVVVGIRTGGVYLAQRLRNLIGETAHVDVPSGAMDITLYRDDAFTGLPRPEVGPTNIPCSLEGKVVLLVDDVLYTGRTVRAALEELMEFGRPAKVLLAVLVDRGHRELPIQADFAGLTVQTTLDQTVRVLLNELGEQDQVVLCERGQP